MKKLYILSMLIVITYGCDKKSSQINSYFGDNLKDPSSLEIIEQKENDITVSRIAAHCMGERSSEYRFKTENDNLLVLDKDKTVLGKMIEVKYRSNNSFGAKDINYSFFVFSLNDKLLFTSNNSLEALSKSCNYLYQDIYNDEKYFIKKRKSK
ncbi:hypothetical protein [Aquimarina celericrescens]|uniref:Lipoprotein n=1 Tax=Aquimarina celericrescens TaxID=1964542 RepID=A0ABW5AW55_9FLAO|nr:hypothetical protein [Aquimarina celericrescens]